MMISCHSSSQTPTTPKAASTYTFKKADLPTINPCIKCVMTSAKKRYRRGRLSLPACSAGSTDERFLKLSLTKGSIEQKVILFRDCISNVSVAGIVLCPQAGGARTCGFDSSENGWTVSDVRTIFCQDELVLTTKLVGSYVEVSLAAGWALHYETQICPRN